MHFVACSFFTFSLLMGGGGTPLFELPFNPPQYEAAPPRQQSLPSTNERDTLMIQHKTRQWGHLRVDFDPQSHPNLIAFRIVGPVSGLVIKDQDQPAIGDLDGLVAWITRHAQSDREKSEALFQFVVDYVKDWYYPAQKEDFTVEDLKVLIWNFGFGYCYDLGRLQAGLWAEAGLPSRIVGWPQHTVAEVYFDESWRLYDLQHRQFYELPEGGVAGFQDLKQRPNLFNQKLNKNGLDPIGYPPKHLADWYGDASPKFEESSEGPHWKRAKEFTIDLRWGETFEILYSEPAKIYHPPSWVQYYGEMTLTKEPPWPVKGRHRYAPHIFGGKPEWELVQTPNGTVGQALELYTPFIISEAWMTLTQQSEFRKIWVEVDGKTHFAGRLVGSNLSLSRFVEGGHHYRIIVEQNDNEEDPSRDKLKNIELHALVQMSHIGLPRLKPGTNWLPMVFQKGRPIFEWYYLPQSADLTFLEASYAPMNPSPGQTVWLEYQIVNRGGATNPPTTLTVFNNTTGLLSETVEKVGVATIPPIEPGGETSLRVPWIANTRMTWYGQNPNHQIMDAWIDITKDRSDRDRTNNRKQHFVVLSNDQEIPREGHP